MKKLINFRTFKRHCSHYKEVDICGCSLVFMTCTEKNCPVFKKLKEVKR